MYIRSRRFWYKTIEQQRVSDKFGQLQVHWMLCQETRIKIVHDLSTESEDSDLGFLQFQTNQLIEDKIQGITISMSTLLIQSPNSTEQNVKVPRDCWRFWEILQWEQQLGYCAPPAVDTSVQGVPLISSTNNFHDVPITTITCALLTTLNFFGFLYLQHNFDLIMAVL